MSGDRDGRPIRDSYDKWRGQWRGEGAVTGVKPRRGCILRRPWQGLCPCPCDWLRLVHVLRSGPGIRMKSRCRQDAPRNAREVSSCPRDCCDRYGYYEQGGLADMDDDVRVMELVEDTVSQEPRLHAQEKESCFLPSTSV